MAEAKRIQTARPTTRTRPKPIKGMVKPEAQKRNYAVNLHPHVWYPSPKAKATGRNNKGPKAVVKALRRPSGKGDTA